VQTFASNQDLLDTLWGYYFATGSHLPILRIMQMLPWSKSRDTVDKLTVGSRRAIRWRAMRSAIRLARILAQRTGKPAGSGQGCRSARSSMPRTPCNSARCAAMRSPRGRAQDQGFGFAPQSRLLGQVGVARVALGCVSAAALGQVEVGIPA